MNPLSKLNHIPWKYVLGMNLSIVALAVTFASLQPATTTTEQRSQAKESPLKESPSGAPDPKNLPELQTPDITWAKIGDAVVVKGKNLGKAPYGTLSIGLIEISRENIVSWEADQIVITVPENAKTNVITLKHELGTTTTKTVLEITKTNRQ